MGMSSSSWCTRDRETRGCPGHIKIREGLREIGVRPNAPLFRALLTTKAIVIDEAHELLPKAKVQELLSLNILSAHPDSTYTFHDRHVMRFMERAAASRRGWWR